MPYGRVLVPFDGSPGSWQALRRAMVMARGMGSTVTALSVEENLPHYAATVGETEAEKEQANEYFARVQAEAKTEANKQGVGLETATIVGHAAQSIIRYAQENGFELIAIGHSGHSGIWGVLLGSTTARVVDQAQCDVLVVR
jgi:nucleotide-binding universal stress UspA family protein